MVDNTG